MVEHARHVAGALGRGRGERPRPGQRGAADDGDVRERRWRDDRRPPGSPRTSRSKATCIRCTTRSALPCGGAAGLPAGDRGHLSVSLFNRLVDDLPQIKVLKHEDGPGLGKIRASAPAPRATAAPRRHPGRQRRLYYPLELARGADGAMTGFAFPEVLVGLRALRRRAHRGRVRAVRRLSAADPYEQQPGIGLAIRKEILHRRGVLASPMVRAPGARLDAHDRAEYRACSRA